ncbi:MAG: hypothetical protein JNL74_10135, partial [Fibrobacteres bacterium]|nr:hypothetical protein [Fibrobacterota bacterium]
SSNAESIETAPIVNSVPVIFLDRHPETIADKINVVTTDNESAAFALTMKVIESGVSSVAVFFNADNAPSHARKRGALRALAETGVSEFNKSDTIHGAVGCVASSQNELINFSKANPEVVLSGGGTFDKWIGSGLPFKRIFVCTQDFKGMADTAVKVLMGQFNGNGTDVKEIVRINYLSITEPE